MRKSAAGLEVPDASREMRISGRIKMPKPKDED